MANCGDSAKAYGQVEEVGPAPTIPCKRTVTPVCDSGDVILALADGIQYKVASGILCLASRPLKRMFNDFLEGTRLNVNEPPIIDFLDDDATGMQLLLYLLHHKSREYVEQSTKALLQLVVVADKYACLHAVRGNVLAMLKKTRHTVWRQCTPTDYRRSTAHLNEILDVLAIAYCVREPKLFVQSCCDVMDGTRDDTLVHAHSRRGLDLVPTQLYQHLAEQRAQRRTSLMGLLRYFYGALRHVARSRPAAFRVVYESLARAVPPEFSQDWNDYELTQDLTTDQLEELIDVWQDERISGGSLVALFVEASKSTIAGRDGSSVGDFDEQAAAAAILRHQLIGWLEASPRICIKCVSTRQWPLGKVDPIDGPFRECSSGCDFQQFCDELDSPPYW